MTVKTAFFPLVLASASSHRLSLLHQIGVRPQHLHQADIDETPKKREHPYSLAKRLAKEKVISAAEVTRRLPGLEQSLILAADTVVAVGNLILPKAEFLEDAEFCLQRLSGRQHKVFTAICLLNANGNLQQKVVESRVRFAYLNQNMIDAYLDSGEWKNKAGGYGIQGLAALFILRIIGSYSAIVGLDLAVTAEFLRAQSYPLYQNWQTALTMNENNRLNGS